MDEREWVALAMAGDDNAFVKLYEKYYVRLYRYAVYTLRTTEDAQDVVSDTVADAYASIKKLKNLDNFGGWIFRILSNKCKAKMKDYYINADGYGDLHWDEEEDHQEEMMDQQMLKEVTPGIEDSVIVKQLFMQLPERERMVLSLLIFSGYDSKEVGEILGINDSTVRSIRKRSLAKLAKEMNA